MAHLETSSIKALAQAEARASMARVAATPSLAAGLRQVCNRHATAQAAATLNTGRTGNRKRACRRQTRLSVPAVHHIKAEKQGCEAWSHRTSLWGSAE